jgi:hypothetical protein
MYAVEIDSGARMLTPGVIKSGSGIQTLTHRQHGGIISLLLYFSF